MSRRRGSIGRVVRRTHGRILVQISLPAILLACALPVQAQAGARAQTHPTSEPRGQLQASAVEATRAIQVDGFLDEPDWLNAPVMNGFRQVEPVNGAPASFDTEVRILFDAASLYIGIIAHDTLGRAGLRVPEMRRDWAAAENDYFGISLDGFGDARTALAFEVTPLGALRDLRVSDGTRLDPEWKGVWEARTRIMEAGWSAEIRIPWSTLRYAEDEGPWKVNFVRTIRRLGEVTAWSAWPRANNAYTMQYAGTLDGLSPRAAQRDLRVQPYLTVRSSRSSPASPDASRDPPRAGILGPSEVRTDVGGDVKWAFSPSSVLDLTVNTDFAEADADREVVDLSRFSVFFPEQRPFFLENAGLFQVGGGRFQEPFFSRRIGLDATGAPIPIAAGARFTHQSAAQSAGALLIRQGGRADHPVSTFGVGRYQRNIGAANRVGALLVTRFDEATWAGPEAGAEGSSGEQDISNVVAAVDAFVRPTRTLSARTMLSGSWTEGAPDNGWSAYAHVSSLTDLGYLGWVQSIVSSGYNPAAGFVPRRDLVTTSPAMILDLRPEWLPTGVRSFTPGFTSYVYHRASDLAFQEGSVHLRPLQFDFHSGAQFTLFALPSWQVLEREFRPLPGVAIDPGTYRFTEAGFTYRPDLSAPYLAYVTFARGAFFDGTRERLVYRASPLPGPQVRVTFDYSANRLRDVGSPGMRHTTHLVGAEVRGALNPRLQVVSLYQRNTVTAASSWSVRVAWEFRPLSHLYLVFSDRRPLDEMLPPRPGAEHRRVLILKGSYLR